MSPSTQSPATTPPKAEDLLAGELAAFQRELPRLLGGGEQGRWALVQGDAVVSAWDTFEAAVQAGYERFGLLPFLVEQVVTERPAAKIPWQRPACPS